MIHQFKVDTEKLIHVRVEDLVLFRTCTHISTSFLVCLLHPFFFQVCTSRITLQKNQLKPGISLPTCTLEAVAAFQIQSAVPLTLLLPGCIAVTTLKFPDHVKLQLCMTGSPSVLTGLSSPVLRSHQYLFGVEAFL